jgi:D-glycero-D-manno-heptose 1,7-bisphosphate phosphatase
MVPLSALQDIHLRLQRAVEAAGGRIVDIFYCPHHPDDCCDCRKPAPGMILAAGRRHHVNLSSAVMIGDTVKDIHCGRNAGCGATILVRTGNGRAAERALRSQGVDTIVADDLSHAARMLVSERHRVFSDR